MKVLVMDVDGKNNGVLMRDLLKAQHPNIEFRLVAASDKTAGQKTTRKIQALAKSVLGLTVQAQAAEPVKIEDLQWADKIVIENENNIPHLVRRFKGQNVVVVTEDRKAKTKEYALAGKAPVILGVPSTYRVSKDTLENAVKELAEKVKQLHL